MHTSPLGSTADIAPKSPFSVGGGAASNLRFPVKEAAGAAQGIYFTTRGGGRWAPSGPGRGGRAGTARLGCCCQPTVWKRTRPRADPTPTSGCSLLGHLILSRSSQAGHGSTEQGLRAFGGRGGPFLVCSVVSIHWTVQCPLPGVPVSGPAHLTWPPGLQSVYERQGIAVMTPTVPGSPKGPFLGLPRGTMRRQKSIGKQHGHTHEGAPWLSAPRQCPLSSPQACPPEGGHLTSPPGALGTPSHLKLFYSLDTDLGWLPQPRKPSTCDSPSRGRGCVAGGRRRWAGKVPKPPVPPCASEWAGSVGPCPAFPAALW